MNRTVIVGSGLAGHTAAMEIARLSPETEVILVGAEPGVPYDRPPLSKEYLLAPVPRVPQLPQAALYDSTVQLISDVQVQAIDRANRRVVLSNGAHLDYDRLLLATGSRTRQLPDSLLDQPATADRLRYLRHLPDAARLREELRNAERIAVIGGGFIGLEVAAAARQLNRSVVVIERMERLLSRAASPQLSRHVEMAHRAHGVDLRLDASLLRIENRGARLGLVLEGDDIEVDLVLVGIGILPNTELAQACGLAVDNGIRVDAACRTADPHIFAAGEVTNYPLNGARLRSESWNSSGAQAKIAARSMLGHEASFDEMPWFWSDQYDMNIQCLGSPDLAQTSVMIRDAGPGHWMRIDMDGTGQVVGAEAVNMGRDMSGLRRALRAGRPVPDDLLQRATPALVTGQPPAAKDNTLLQGNHG